MSNKFPPSEEQKRIFKFDGKKMVVSASAGSGKTTTMIEYISRLVEGGQPIKRMLVLTFTKAAATEMKERLMLSLIERSEAEIIQEQIDDLFVSDISTIHSFLEKIIKRNIGQFAFLEGFNLLDEQQSLLMQNEAFESAEQRLKEVKHDEYVNLYLIVRDKNLISSIIFKIHDFLSAQANRDLVKARLRDSKNGWEKAKEYLFEKILGVQKYIAEQVDLFPQDNPKATAYLAQVKAIACQKGDGLRQMCKLLATSTLPRQCVLTGYYKKQDVVDIKNAALDLFKFAKKLNPEEEAVWNNDQNDLLIQAIFDLYDLFAEEYLKIKQRVSALDFDDLEKYSEELLEDESVLSELQESYDYVFIDEYQDTNPVQEKIVKLLSEKCKFIAIGDPKQGIYAFRNATSKIILKDSQDFQKMEGGRTEYLSSNYRSDKQILSFVNHVFSAIMTNKTSGIDYKNSSFLNGEKDNPKTPSATVEILISQKPKRAKAESVTDYDIYEDELVAKQSGEMEAKVVVEKIERLLASEFVEPKTNKKRRVEPSDIAILSRSKSDVCDCIMNELRKKEIPFVSTLRSDLTSKPHTMFVTKLLSLCLNKKDDIALASYLFSPLCLVSLNKLALLEGEGTFAEKVLSSTDEEIARALKRLEEFKNDCLFLGAKRALEKMFIEKEFFVYLKSEIGENSVSEMLTLLNIIGAFENDKDLPELISYLKSPLTFANATGQNAVTISSIHASKGLEYPIVFVVGLGKNLLRSEQEAFKLDENFGLGLMSYDEEEMEKYPSLQLVAARDVFSHKERINELMVLYVALTRAKSHLILSGSLGDGDVPDFAEEKFEDYSNFLSLILSTGPQKVGAKVTMIEKIEEFVPLAQKLDVTTSYEELKNGLDEYLKFAYPFEEDTRSKQKSSVTALAHSGEEFTVSDNNFALEGTAYHEALRILDFEKIQSEKDVEIQLEKNNFNEEYKKLIKNSVIFENIMLIKPFIKNKKIIKEKQFTMKLDSDEGARLVQGTIDLYLKGDTNILIDYKYSREKDEKALLDRYRKQLALYKKAIEEAEKVKVDEVYLISLKNKKIIKY